jgi:hypothetical protein
VPAHWVVNDLPFPDRATACAPAAGGLQNLRVVDFGAGLLALGSCAHTTDPGLVWIGSGGTWQALAPAALAHADVYDLITVDGLLIAVGQDVSDGFAAAAWTSRDGLSWTHSRGDLGCAVMSSVTRFGSGFIAFGSRGPLNVEGFIGEQSGTCEWVSADGLSWARVSLPKAVFPATASVSALSTGPGGLIAAGTDAGPKRSLAALWRSSDGRDWTRLATDWAADWSSLDQALPGGPGIVVLGTDAHGNAGLATSVYGVAWTNSPAPGQGTLYSGPSLAAGPAGLIFGGFTVNGSPSPAMAWLSLDGVSWRPAPALPTGLTCDSVATAAGTFVVAATSPDRGAAIVTLQP